METEKVNPDQIQVGDRIVTFTTEADSPHGARHYEVRTVRLIEPPDRTHDDSYDFEYEAPGTDHRLFIEGVRFPVDDLVERVVLSTTPKPTVPDPWQHRQ